MGKFVKILKWWALAIYFPVLLAFVSVSKSSLVCSNVVVQVKDSATAQFVSSSGVRKLLLNRFPEVLGARISEIDYEAIEESIEKHPAIRSCQVFNNAHGTLNVKITQHEPILRIFNGSSSYYLDENGTEIPVSGRFSARVMVVNGKIPREKDDLLTVARFIIDDSFWNAQVEQIYIRKNGDYLLVPRVGEHLILLGSSERLEEKMDNLMSLYNELNPKEWNKYKTINLKFKGQVICSRSSNLY
jgi:cell division protein FtsQ